MEFLFNQVKSTIPDEQQENLKHYLRNMTNRFTNNVYQTSDYTYKVLQKLASDEDTVVLCGDKDSSVVILPKSKYVEKVESLIKEGIREGKYEETCDTTAADLLSFKTSYNGTLRLFSLLTKSSRLQINQHSYTAQLKHINFILQMKLLPTTSPSDQSLAPQGLSTMKQLSTLPTTYNLSLRMITPLKIQQFFLRV